MRSACGWAGSTNSARSATCSSASRCARARYETSAVPIPVVSIDQAATGRFSVNGGIGVKLGHFDVSLAYGHFFQPDLQVRTSAVLQSRPPERAKYETIISNGDYTQSI